MSNLSQVQKNMADIPDRAFFRELAEAASAETLPRFRKGGAIANKDMSGFDPVTEADREAERVIRAMIVERYPDHGIVGEELGNLRPDAQWQWVIDPIDGTRAFIAGLPVWGTLVGVKRGERAVAGFMSQPFTGELFVADEDGAFLERDGDAPVALRTRSTQDLGQAILFTTSPHLHAGPARGRYEELEAAVRLARYGCDCYAFALLAAGHVDIVVESGLQPYDIVGLVALIEKAGGVVSTWDGQRPESGGDILATANPGLHQRALARLSGRG